MVSLSNRELENQRIREAHLASLALSQVSEFKWAHQFPGSVYLACCVCARYLASVWFGVEKSWCFSFLSKLFAWRLLVCIYCRDRRLGSRSVYKFNNVMLLKQVSWREIFLVGRLWFLKVRCRELPVLLCNYFIDSAKRIKQKELLARWRAVANNRLTPVGLILCRSRMLIGLSFYY